ncbi:MAG: metal-dependent hydrolase [Methanomassiliicoccales archaeon]|nr:metal-dependent hydrolase [Methanomassiliicoccales archaeon]
MTEIEYLGHSAFVLRHGGDVVLIDPFITGNPSAPASAKDVRPTLILVTHAHSDHAGDTVELSKRHGCPVLTTFEVGNRFAEMGAEVISGHIGGEFSFPFGKVKIFAAVHSSSFDDVNCVGVPCSFIVEIGGKVIFHAGDTALFGDMTLIAEEFAIDVALLPVGGTYTMGIKDAVRAMRMLGAKRLVPMHYATFEAIALRDDDIQAACAGAPFVLSLLRPGERLHLA